jgi:hypothetical protein
MAEVEFQRTERCLRRAGRRWRHHLDARLQAPDEGHLTLTRGELAALVAAARAGELDDLA